MFRAVKATGDTTAESPLYFAETLSDYYYQKKPFTKVMDPVSTHTLGMSTDRILEQLAVWDFNVNLYDNWLNVFYRDFASPIADGANNYYDYYITDTVRVAGKRLIQVHFVPKDPEGKVFLGDLTIEDSTYAVTDVVLILRTQANMNYVRSIKLQQSFACVDDQNSWAMVRNKVDVVFESGWTPGYPYPQ